MNGRMRILHIPAYTYTHTTYAASMRDIADGSVIAKFLLTFSLASLCLPLFALPSQLVVFHFVNITASLIFQFRLHTRIIDYIIFNIC